MPSSIISAGNLANLGVQTTGGDDGALVIRSGAAGAVVDAISISAAGALGLLAPLPVAQGGTVNTSGNVVSSQVADAIKAAMPETT